jgi:ABC-2 type transport system permease protein
MNKLFVFHPDIFRQVLLAKLTNIRSVLTSKIIDVYIWAGCNIFIMGYLMQSFGLAQNFGAFQFAGILAVVGMFELYGNTVGLVADFEGDCTIAYYFTLPASFLTVLSGYVCYYLIISTSMCLALLPLGKIMLWNQLNLVNVSWGKFLVFMGMINLLWAFFAFVLAAYIPSMEKFGMLWHRIIFPLWLLGGFQFSWLATYAVSPIFSYAMLLNPCIYATEGMRAAILGQDGYLSFWVCLAVMVALCFIGGWWAVKALKKRLDLV